MRGNPNAGIGPTINQHIPALLFTLDSFAVRNVDNNDAAASRRFAVRVQGKTCFICHIDEPLSLSRSDRSIVKDAVDAPAIAAPKAPLNETFMIARSATAASPRARRRATFG
jgi:hypothetical protein